MAGIRRVLIVGGGVGGLTLALVLERAGIPATVFEQAPELKEVGAGLTLWCSAVRVLDRLGVGAALRDGASALYVTRRCTARGDVVSEVDLREVCRGLDGDNLFIHRAHLQRTLASALPGGTIVLGARCTGFAEEGGEVVATFSGHGEARGDLLVGADGLRSAVRARLWGDGPPAYSGETCWRAVLQRAGFSDANVLRQVYGPGSSAGICGLDGDRIYYRLDTTAKEGERDAPGRCRAALLDRFRGWPFGIPELIEATPEEAFLRNDIYDRPPLPAWSRGRCTLLGDAAHPTVPNLGQGACMAIEDAMVLGRALAAHGEVVPALQAYEAERRERTAQIVRRSRLIGRIDRSAHPLVVRAREIAYGAFTARFGRKLLRSQLAYDAGDLPSPAARG